jgi:DNA polymerase/3'-5' exonuclease PolX
MSIVAEKATYRRALEVAEGFRALFPATAYERWEFAGSIRRRRPECGDVDHVIIPRFGEVSVGGGGLFDEKKTVNLVMHRLDELVTAGQVKKHIYGTDPETSAPKYRWGDKLRGINCGGLKHELWMAEEANWGPTFTIRTGPGEFSQMMVTRLRRQGMRNEGGYVWRCEGPELALVERLSVPTEELYFQLAGVPFVKPEVRQ